MIFTCAHCGKCSDKPSGEVNRANRQGRNLYCGRACAGIARRSALTVAEKKVRKAEYDRDYRARDPEGRKAAKHEWFKRTYDPDKERVKRKQNMHRHVEYCRRPEYKAQKSFYDQEKRADEYGDFKEVWRLLLAVEKELRAQASGYERRKQRGYYTRSAQLRRRALWLARQATP